MTQTAVPPIRVYPRSSASHPVASASPYDVHVAPGGEVWIDLATYAAARGETYGAVAHRATNGTIPSHLFPSLKHAGKLKTRIPMHRLAAAEQRDIERYLARYGQITPDAYLAEIEARFGAEVLAVVNARWQAVERYQAIHPRTLVHGVTGERVDSRQVAELCAANEVCSATLRRWASAFEACMRKGSDPQSLQRAFNALVPGKPGQPDRKRVLRGEDHRFRLRYPEIALIRGIYAQRNEPSKAWVWERLTDECIRCHAAAMQPAEAGYRGRMKSHACPECGFQLSYKTVVRVIDGANRASTLLGRRGRKVYDDAFSRYAERNFAGTPRNAVVDGDHHVLDILVYDDRERTRDGKPVMFRPWLTAWHDTASGVVEGLLVRRANADSICLAFRRYTLRFGRPEIAYTDNGQDYISERFTSVCQQIGTQMRNAEPSRRDGSSHARSKPIERFFGTFERDFLQHQPGWKGADTTKRKDLDALLFTQEREHAAFIRGERADTPFLSFQQLDVLWRTWLEQVYWRRPQAERDAGPMGTFLAGTSILKTVSPRALDILLMEAPRSRCVFGNGVKCNGEWYWSERLYGHEGEECTVRVDPSDLAEVIVQVAGHTIIAAAKLPANWSREDARREAQEKARQARAHEDMLRVWHMRSAGVTPRDVVLAEQAAREVGGAPPEPARMAAAAGCATPIITEAHGIALALDAQVSGARCQVPGPRTTDHEPRTIRGGAEPPNPPARRPRLWDYEPESGEELSDEQNRPAGDDQRR